MDSTAKSQRKILAAKDKKGDTPALESRASPRKNGKSAEKMPELIAGKEVLGRKLSVIKTSRKEAIWVKGAVKAFDEPTVRHKIAYDLPLPEVLEQEGEEWLCLAKEGFMWRDDDFVCPVANPTYSAKHTPKREDAIGKRVKVFWTAMSKWYQGKVVAYDPATAKHKVSFRDGEQNEYLLQQEALVWLDIPELSSDAALKKMRQEEGDPVAVIRDDENQAPVEKQQPGPPPPAVAARPTPQTNGKAATPAAKAGTKRKGKATSGGQCKGSQASPKANTRRAKSVQPKAAKPEAPKAGKKPEGSAPAKRGRKSAAAKAAEKGVKKASPAKPVPDAKKKVEEGPAIAPPQPMGASKELTSSISIVATGNGKHLPKVAIRGPTARSGSEEGTRKRSRLGNPALPGSPLAAEQPEAKRRTLGRPPVAQPKPLHWKRRAAQEALAAAQREKEKAEHVWTEHDFRFQECAERVLGARVGVWWDEDRCYYKGKVVAHDWFERQLRIHYDDGVEETIVPFCDTFRWLTPRATTAGATDAMHSSFVYLRASNACASLAPRATVASQASTPEVGGPSAAQATTAAPQPAVLASPVASGVPMVNGGSSPASTGSAHTADGSHLDALVPIRPSSSQGSGPGKATAATATMPQPVDSTTRGPHSAAVACDPAGARSAMLANGGVANGVVMGQPHIASTTVQSIMAGLHMRPANGHHPATMDSATPLANGTGATSRPPSLAPITQKSSLARFAMTPEPGAPPTCPTAPKGAAAVGWKVSLVFRGDHQMFQGRLLAFDASRPQPHLVLWDDGEHEWIDVAREQLTWHAGERGQNPGFGAGLPAGVPTPKGYALEGWRLSVFWPRVGEFYEGTVTRYDPELNEHTISYNDGEERTEPIDTLVFKYVLDPEVNRQARDSVERLAADSKAVDGRRARTSRRWREGSSEREDTPTCRGRPRRRQRARSYEDDSDYEDEEWTTELVVGGNMGGSSRPVGRPPAYVPPIRHLNLGSTANRLSLMHQHVNSPIVRTPGGSDIRRMNSKGGSLLVFEGEDNPLATPATSPRACAPVGAVKRNASAVEGDAKPRPVLERRVSGLKSGQGFRVGVKRVRLYLQSLPAIQEPQPDGQKAGGTGQQDGSQPVATKSSGQSGEVKAEEGTPVPSEAHQQSLKLMLDRVEAASASMQNGVPAVPPPASSLAEPSKPLPSVVVLTTQTGALGSSNLAADSGTPTLADANQQPGGGLKQERHPTPPPSPFATYRHVSETGDEGDEQPTPLEDLRLDGGKNCACESRAETADQLRAVPVLGHGSLNLSPDTPSTVSEAQLVALSRNGSIISEPTLAELLHAKLACAGKRTPADGPNLAGA